MSNERQVSCGGGEEENVTLEAERFLFDSLESGLELLSLFLEMLVLLSHLL